MNWHDLPILRKQLIAIVLTSLVVLPLSGWVLFNIQKRSHHEQAVQSVRGLAQFIAANSAAMLMFNDPASAQETLAGLRTEPEIQRAAIYDVSGKPFAWYPTNSPSPQLPPRPPALGLGFEGNRMTLVEPIQEGQVNAGTLYIEANLSRVQERLRDYAGVLIVVLLASGALALILSHLMQKQITRPVLALAATTRRVAAEQNFGLRAEKVSNDELGQLADAFNQMLLQAQEHRAQLTAELAQRTKAEEALRRNHQQLQVISDNIPALISYVSPECRYQFCNLAYTLWFGLHPDKIIGRHMRDILGDRAWAAVAPHVQAAFAGHPEEFETEAHYARGGTRWIHAIYTPDRDPSGNVAGVVVMVHDITDRKRAERELQEAQAELARHAEELERTVAERTAQLRETIADLETFSYSVSHDMRAPLRSINGYAEILLNDPGISAQHKQFLHRISRSATRMDRLIQDMLAYSRMAKTQLELRPVDLETLVRDVIQQYPQFQSPMSKIEVRGPLGSVLAHEAAMTQVISNLLGNAVKFVEPGALPQIRIWSEHTAPFIKLCIQDNGIGIDPKDQHRIFGIFERLHSERDYEGTGIGLSIVKKAVERMGGTVSLQSELGRGSRFCVQLKKA